MFIQQVLPVVILLCQGALALNNGLALTPPMGWLSWVRFRCNVDCKNDPENCISEHLYKTMALRMVKDGFKDAGYEYVNIDDCWSSKERDAQGYLQADPERFPSGIKALADFMHSLGLKLGIYGDFGRKTCAGYPGSEFYMERDAHTIAAWGVDMFKFDGCNSDVNDMSIGYPLMQLFMNQTGHPMVYSCEWPVYNYMHKLPSDYSIISKVCNTWRNYNDVGDSWDSVMSVINFYGKDADNVSHYAGPGAFSDPDMLVVGDFGLSSYQEKAQFGMWALFAAPLMMSVDLRSLNPEAKALLQNRNIIAINQDPLGKQAIRISTKGNSAISVWVKKLASGASAIGLLNSNESGVPAKYSFAFIEHGFSNLKGYQVTEAFENKSMGRKGLKEKFTVIVDPTSVFIMIAKPL